ncbi:MAG: DUF3052 domain-containing protein [Actinomycetota bacterium]|nr:DUF3052 domain-containing protein [Actinomycetota bacterium]
MTELRGPAGYSGTPLVKKLGIKAGHRVLLAGAPDDFAEEFLGPLPEGATLLRSARPPVHVGVVFAIRRAELRRRFAAAVEVLEVDGGLWVAYPKKASGVATELDFNGVQRHGLDEGMVDNKSCAVTEVWSGLRFVWRLSDREGRRHRRRS